MLCRALDSFFRRRERPSDQEKFELIARVVSGTALDGLLDTARTHESDWSDRTRFTVIGYLVGAVQEAFPNGTLSDREQVMTMAYQHLCSSLVIKAELIARIARLEVAKDQYFLAGAEAAGLDYEAVRNKQIVHGFVDALQFPRDRTFEAPVES